jgi:phage terminase large subunit-like protein
VTKTKTRAKPSSGKARRSSWPRDPVTRYAEAVVGRRVVTNRLVRLACERHLRDLEQGPARGLSWDQEAVKRVSRFFSQVLRLNGGDFEGKPFDLQRWQLFIEGSLFGWKRSESGLRRFRTAYIEVAKGSGKSPLAAGTGMYMLTADREPRAEVYAAAGKKDQAMILFRDAVAMVDQSPLLAKRVVKSGVTPVWNLAVPSTGSFFRPIASDDTQSGPRPHCALLDEIHEHDDATVLDLMRAGSKGRRQALFFEITNSGWDQTSVCWRHHDYSVQVLEGVLEDDEWFAYICGLDQGDDWRDEKVWPKANPNLGVSITKNYLRRQVREAEGMPAQQGVVRRLNFCEWTELAQRWLEEGVWERNNAPVDLARLAGRRCFGGLDLSSTEDMCSLQLVFPDAESYDVLSWYWMPAANARKRAQEDRVPYDVWQREGYLTLTQGNIVDQDAIKRTVFEVAQRYALRDLAFDRWNSSKLITEIQGEWGERGDQDEGPRVVQFGQGYASMSAPTKEVERLLLEGRIRHGGHPILAWNAANVVMQVDAAENRKPVKAHRRKRIDGVIALIMAIGRAMVAPAPPTGWLV